MVLHEKYRRSFRLGFWARFAAAFDPRQEVSGGAQRGGTLHERHVGERGVVDRLAVVADAALG